VCTPNPKDVSKAVANIQVPMHLPLGTSPHTIVYAGASSDGVLFLLSGETLVHHAFVDDRRPNCDGPSVNVCCLFQARFSTCCHVEARDICVDDGKARVPARRGTAIYEDDIDRGGLRCVTGSHRRLAVPIAGAAYSLCQTNARLLMRRCLPLTWLCLLFIPGLFWHSASLWAKQTRGAVGVALACQPDGER
jgi:hypothetical protein